MKNKNGFTLVELLISIAILAIILIIAIPAYNKISNSVATSQRKNIIKYLEAAASKYAFETGENIVLVETLIEKNYVTADNDKNEIIDPVDKLKMNCFYLKMQKKGDFYIAKFIDKRYEEKDGTCNLSNIKKEQDNIDIILSNNNIIITEEKWVSGSVKLEADSTTIPINCSISKCSWTSGTGANIKGQDNILITPPDGASVNTGYVFQLETKDNDGITKKYLASINVKIDNKNPEINQTSYKDNILTINATDIGSGIEEYGISKDQNNACLSYQKENKFDINEPGLYTLCVKDKVGNIGVSSYTIN